MENFSDYVNLFCYIAIGGLFIGFCFFFGMGMMENRRLRIQGKQLKAELLAATKTDHFEEDKAELERLHAEVTAYLESMRQKDQEIKRLTDLLKRAAEDQRGLEEAATKTGRSEEDKAELERLHEEVTAYLESTKQKDQEIERLADLLKRATEDQRRLEEAALKIGRSKEDKAELERLHAEVTAYLESTKQKDQEIERLADLLKRATEDQRRLEEAAMKTGRSGGDAAELKRLRAEVAAHLESTKQKDQEIEKLKDLLDRIFNNPDQELPKLQKGPQSD